LAAFFVCACSGSVSGPGDGDGDVADGDAGYDYDDDEYDHDRENDHDMVECTVVVEDGDSLQQAADGANPGDAICIRSGDYAPFKITRSGNQQEPIVFMAYPGEERQVRITRDDFSMSQGIKVEDAEHIVIDGLWVDQVNQGIFVLRSNFIVVRNNLVTDIGQECLRFKWSDDGAFIDNLVHGCGRRASEGMNGEGIYVGSGDEPNDDTHGALIRGNHIYDVTDEGIELKGATYECTVEYNIVHDLACKDGGGIKVSRADGDDISRKQPGHIVRGNIVYNVSTRTQYSDGNGINVHRGARVYNNVAYGNQHYGIRIDDKSGFDYDVEVYHNTFFNNGSGEVGLFDGISPDMQNNLGYSGTGNMDAQTGYFENAAEGDFHLKAGSDPIDAGNDVGVAEDIEKTSRPQGDGFDMGAYEFKNP
jgi:hypothetical protein